MIRCRDCRHWSPPATGPHQEGRNLFGVCGNVHHSYDDLDAGVRLAYTTGDMAPLSEGGDSDSELRTAAAFGCVLGEV